MREEIHHSLETDWADFSISPTLKSSYAAAKRSSDPTLTLRHYPQGETPRERLLTEGAGHLSNTELLAILLGSGNASQGESAVALAQKLLAHLQNHLDDATRSMREAKPEILMQVNGIGEAKAATILAAIELGRRLFLQSPPIGTVIDSPELAAQALSKNLMFQPQERFAVLLLNIKHQLLGQQLIAIGSGNQTCVQPPDVFREAIRQNAARLILAHNHPSGNLTPSPEDIALTKQLLDAGQLLMLPVLDHLILGNGDFLSLRTTTTLWSEISS